MSTLNKVEQKVTKRRMHPVVKFGLIAVAIVILVALAMGIYDYVSQSIKDQQTEQALHSKPVTAVAITNFEFSPANIQVKVGTTVTWTNKDSVAHTITFNNGMKDSGNMNTGASFSYTFTQPGTFSYYCAYHREMLAQVVVTQ